MDFDPGTLLSHSPLTHAAMLASDTIRSSPNAITFISGLDTFTFVMVDNLPLLWPHIVRYLPTRKVLFWPAG